MTKSQVKLQQKITRSLIILTLSAVLLLAGGLITVNSVSAHYLWIETPLTVETGEEAGFEIYWGHLDDDPADMTTTGVSVYLQSPAGLVSELDYQNRDIFLEGKFYSRQSGVQQLIVRRPAGVYQLSLNQFTARSLTLAAEDGEEMSSPEDPVPPAGLPLEINPAGSPADIAEKNSIEFILTYLGNPLTDTEVILLTRESYDSPETFLTDQEGRFEADVPEQEALMLTVSHIIPAEGEHNGYEYDQIQLNHTFFLNR